MLRAPRVAVMTLAVVALLCAGARDIEHPSHPRVVSNLRLAVNMRPAHRAAAGDPFGLPSTAFTYGAHYCAVPHEVDPGIVACSFINSGLRIFDIRHPAHPRESGYYVSPTGSSDPSLTLHCGRRAGLVNCRAVADRSDLEFTYSLIDRIFRLSLGELADFSGAKYDGDFSLSLEEAQARKHAYVAESIGIEPGRRVLDLGCGWGPLLSFIRSRGADGVGVTLSSAQAAACRRHGLEVHLRDARTVDRDTFGPFDAVASLGAFEHFCSVEDYRAGKQEQGYRELFANIAGVLPAGGRLYLQTMVFGPNMIDPEEVSIDAPRDSDAWILALLERQFPGSFLPFGSEQVIECASGEFELVSAVSGRLDYIETIKQWRKRFGQPSFRKTLMKARLVPKWLTSSDFRLAFTSGVSANGVCFERELLDHFRLVFAKRA